MLSALLLLAAFSVAKSKIIYTYTFWDCRHFTPWHVNRTVEHNRVAMANMQEFLYAWQNSPEKCAKGTVNLKYSAGLGADIGFFAAHEFLGALETGRVFRPTVRYPWADSEPANCTLNHSYFDCFYQSLSGCGMDSIAPSKNAPSLAGTEIAKKLLITKTSTDFCELGQVNEKPLTWVLGQVIIFLTRPRDDIAGVMKARIAEVVSSSSTCYIAVHYRAGQPDYNRIVHHLDKYMDAVVLKAAEMAAIGQPVEVVYLASQDNLAVFQSVEHMSQTYPAAYKYKLLPYEITNGSREFEHLIKENENMSRKPLVTEFLTDLRLFAEANVFIGSVSNIYHVSAAMRYALHPERSNQHTCMIDRNGNLVCEGSKEAVTYWQWAHLGHLGGFQGGVPF